METLSGWVRQLVLLVLVVSVLELIAPANGLRKYVRLVVAFLVLTAVLAPLVALVRGDDLVRQVMEAAELGFPTGSGGSSGAPASPVETDQRLRNDLFARQVAAYLRQELSGEAGGRIGVTVRVEGEGVIERITLTTPPGQGSRLRGRASALTGVEKERIVVVEEAIP